MDPKIFGVSLLTIAVILGAFYVGRHTSWLNMIPVVG